MDGTSSRSSSLAALDQRDVALVRWFLTNPPLVSAALQTAASSPHDQHGGVDEESAALASRLASNVPAHLRFFATVVMDFGPFRVPGEKENERFEALQRLYHDLHGNEAAARPNNSTCMRLSPRMIVDYAEPKSKRRDDLSRAVNEHLSALAKEVEGQLLDEVDEETSNLRLRKERERRRRKAKKKKKQKAKQKAGGDDEHANGNQHVEPCSTIESASHDENSSSTNSIDVERMAASHDENSTPNDEAQPSNNVEKNASSKISYLAAAAKVPKAKGKTRSSAAAATHPPPQPPASAQDKSEPSATAETEKEAITRLQEQLEAQRRGHLEILQQVQLRAFIAETKANSALDKSRQLERQILDATYPEVEATRVEIASVEVGSTAGPLSPRKANNNGTSKTREDLEHELRAQRRQNLAMMNRVQMRTFLAETKAKAAEEHSLQLEKLLKDAQEGKEVA